jgi:hypothetical protein
MYLPTTIFDSILRYRRVGTITPVPIKKSIRLSSLNFPHDLHH